MTLPLPSTPASPLRQRLIEDTTMRPFATATQRNYIRDVSRFAAFLRRPPDTASAEGDAKVLRVSLSSEAKTARLGGTRTICTRLSRRVALAAGSPADSSGTLAIASQCLGPIAQAPPT